VTEQAEALFQQLKLDIRPYWDDQKRTQLAALAVLNEPNLGFPLTLVLDQKGAIRGVWPGYAGGDLDDIRTLIQSLLKKPAQESPSPASNSATTAAGSAA
jgi:hypothetical protein